MKKNVKTNYIYNLFYQVLIILLPIITTPYISRVLGAENIGIYSYTLSISAYFILFGSIGIALYGKREIAYVQNNKSKYSKLFWELFILRLVTVIISLILFYVLFVYRQNSFNIYYKVLSLELIANAFDISWFFQGLEEFKKTVLRNAIVKLISLICIFTLVKTKDDLMIYFVIYVLSNLVGHLSLWLYLPKYLTKTSFNELNIFKHLKNTIYLFIPQIAIQVYTVLDRTMIGYLISNKAEVGFYTQGEKIVKLLLTIITAMGTVMLPRIASKFSEGDKKTIHTYIYKSFNLVFFLGFPMIFGLISVSSSFVPIFFGKGYDKVIPIMRILAPILLLIGISNVIGMQYLLPTKRQKEYTISVIAGAVINFISNYFLILKLGAIGAAIGTIIAESTVTLIQLISVYNKLDLIKIFKSSFQFLFSALIMFAICYIVSLNIDSNIKSVIVQVVVGGFTYVSLLLLMKNEFVFEVLRRFGIVKGRKKI